MDNNPKASSELLKSLEEQIRDLNNALEIVKNRLDTRGHEVDILQTQIIEKKSTWWKNHSFILSIIAIIISISTVLYDGYKNHVASIAAEKMRIKNIIQRLSEIQAMWANAGENIGAIQGATSVEGRNLVQEAFDFIEKNEKSLSGEEYARVIETAFRMNCADNIITVIEKALRLYPNNPDKNGIMNWLAHYYYLVTKEAHKGSTTIQEIISKEVNRSSSDELRTVSLANEYLIWSNLELQVGNKDKSDSLLIIAENFVVNSKDAWRYVQYPVVSDIRSQRIFFNQVDSIDRLHIN